MKLHVAAAELQALEAKLAAEPEPETAIEIAWHLRHRDTGRALQLCTATAT